MRWRTAWAIAFSVVLTTHSVWAENGPITVELELEGRRIEGTPLAWSKTDVFLLSRDGHLLNFDPNAARNYRKVSDQFASLSPVDLRTQLKSEFGRAYEVTSTHHYLVVHPRGERNQWASRFEELYRSFMRYFTARGMEPKRPLFPLVAVVFSTQEEFRHFANHSGARLLPGTLGYYSPQSNRVLLYDVTTGDPRDPNWQVNAETIVHESIHQMAFNTGVHSRYAMPPRWLAEGLGTYFEARGVSNSDRFSQPGERVNRSRLADFRKYVAAGRATGSLADFLSSDRPFQNDPEAAYAESWGLTFFLFETQAQRYVEYLQKTAARPPFVEYRGPDRLADFQAVFGKDLRQFEARYLRFLAGLQ